MKKKSIAILLAIVLTLTFVLTVSALSADYVQAPGGETQEVSPSPGRIPNVPEMEHWPGDIQEYIPGSIRLFENPLDVFHGQSEILPQRRQAFYFLDGAIINLVPHEEWVAFRDTIPTLEEGLDTMPLVLFIQHFNISRETLEAALMQMSEARTEVAEYLTQVMQEEQARVEMMETHSEVNTTSSRLDRDLTSWPWYDPFADLTHEVNELPNLDIIFTFDNELINWFYRRA